MATIKITTSDYLEQRCIDYIKVMAKQQANIELSDRAAKRYLADCIRNNFESDALDDPAKAIGFDYIA